MKNLKIFILIFIMIVTLIVPNINYGAIATLKIGDINGDGAVDSRDTLRILEHIAASTIPNIKLKHPDWILKNEQFKCGDVNEDGIIDSRDTIKELEYIAASTIPSIKQKHPTWTTYLESKWVEAISSITLNKTNVTIEKGQTVKLVATVAPSNATNKVVEWISLDPTIASVDGIGTVTGNKKGNTVITAKISNGLSKNCKVVVTDKSAEITPNPTPANTVKDITKVSVTLNPTSVVYNGKTQTPAITLKDGVKTLTKGTDYIMSYSNNKNVGTATVSVTGKGNYKGKITKNFKITKATYNMKNVIFKNSTVTYNGQKYSIMATGVPQGVKVTYIGNGQIKAGKYKVVAKFTGDNTNYNSIPDKQAILTINKKPITKATVTGIANKTYTGKAITQNVIIKDGNKTIKNGQDYTLKYENNIKVGTASIIITGNGNYIGTITKKFNILAIKATKIITTAPLWRQIEKGKSIQLSAKVSPDNSTYKTITWSSNNTNVATVSPAGKVIVIGNGKSQITAKQKESGLTATYTIVGFTPPTSISLSKNKTTLDKGISYKLTVSFNPTNVSSKEITWKSSNSNIVSVESSKTTNGSVTIKAKSKGKATITATHKYGKTATLKIEVKVPVTKITLSETSLTMKKGKTHTLKAHVTPEDASNKNIKWSSSNSNIVSVSNGKLTAKSAGTTTITAESNGKKATCKVKVENPEVAVTSIKLNYKVLHLNKGDTANLKVEKITPSNATDKKIVWSSSNSNVVSVSNGKLVAKNPGSAKITAKTSNNKTATCKVNVIIPVTRIELSSYYVSLKVGETKKITATVYPKDATIKQLEWHSEDYHKLSVLNGTIKANNGDTGYVWCKVYSASNSDVKAQFLVHITK